MMWLYLRAQKYNNNLSSVFFPFGVQVLFDILFTCAIQGAQTIGLHYIELLVNMSRDEDAWRFFNPKGKSLTRDTQAAAMLSSSAVKSALSSWQDIALLISNAPLHWLLGQRLLSSILVFEDGKWYFLIWFIWESLFSALSLSRWLHLRLTSPCGDRVGAKPLLGVTLEHFQILLMIRTLVKMKTFGRVTRALAMMAFATLARVEA